TQEGKLGASDAAASDFFGDSVSISGDRIVVGADHDDTAAGSDAGSAYVFVRSGSSWTQEGKLTPADAAAGDVFGASVSISGDRIAAGAAVATTTAGVGAGAAYVF